MNTSSQRTSSFAADRSAVTFSTVSASDHESNAENSASEDAGYNGLGKRKRSLKTSCELCKARKVKCDREEPSCGWCARNNRVCIYKERSKTGPRVGYGRELEDKINTLEAMLQILGRKVEDHIMEHSTSHLGPNGFQNTPVTDQAWPNAYERMHPQPPDTMSIQSIVGATPPGLFAQPVRPGSSTVSTGFDHSLALGESDLPPYDLLYSLVDLYFKHVNPWSPILDRKATLDTLSNSTALDAADRILFHAILATALRFSRDPRLTPQSRQHYHDISKRKIEIYALENTNVRALQALTILAVDALGSSRDSQGSNILALIGRNITLLGLGVERDIYLAASTPSPRPYQVSRLAQPASWIEDEERRRLFWMLYVLDRYTTVATAFDFILDEKDSHRALPCRYDLFSKNQPVETRCFRSPESTETVVNKPENLGSFSYHCEVLRILSRIHKFLRKPIDIGSLVEVHQWRESYRELDSELTTWLHNLPGEYGKISQLCHSDPGSRISNWIMLHAAFVTSVIRLHSSAAYPTSRSYIFTPSHNAMQRCLAAVESLREIVQDVVNGGMLDLLGPPFAFSLWVSARLLIVHAATMECEVDSRITFFISTLEQMGQFWAIAQHYAEILIRIVQEYQQTEPPVSFTAMRRSAYDLNLLMSLRPSTVLNPPTSRAVSSSELEYLDVFDFFNYPRLPCAVRDGLNTPDPSGNNHIDDFRATKFPTPNADFDWLGFNPPRE